MRWRKVGVVAATEFNTAVRSKAFVISILFLPIIMIASVLLQTVVAQRADNAPKTIGVVDRSGTLYQAVAEAADARNAALAATAPKEEDGSPDLDDNPMRSSGSKFLLEPIEQGDRPESEFLLSLSDRLRQGGLDAFVVIPADAIAPKTSEPGEIRFYSANPNDSAIRNWLEMTINAEVRDRRLRTAGIDPTKATLLSRPVRAENLTLLERGRDGSGDIRGAEKVDQIRSALVPAALMFIVFMVVMSSTPQLLQSVIEEKISRISEVLLGSLSPFELMMGKLLGGVGVALVLSTLYVGSSYGAAAYYGYADGIPPYLLAVTAMFIVLAVVLFGSLYLAIGSACSELKDAQSLMMPVMMLSLLPLFFWMAVLKAPNSPLAVGASLFPPATPYLMLMRMALKPGPPAWQVALAIGLTLLTVIACVWAAGRIFRIGLLMQGKPPSIRELVRWAVQG